MVISFLSNPLLLAQTLQSTEETFVFYYLNLRIIFLTKEIIFLCESFLWPLNNYLPLCSISLQLSEVKLTPGQLVYLLLFSVNSLSVVAI